jgi:hypothetical protein
MFCLFKNIFISDLEDLNDLNLTNFSFILNCSSKFNNCVRGPNGLNNSNYINLNLDTKNYHNLIFYEQIYNWLEKHYQHKIVILDQIGLANGMSLCIYMIMKSSNTPFEIIYDILSKITKLNNKLFYKFLQDSESNIIQNYSNLNSMDISD